MTGAHSMLRLGALALACGLLVACANTPSTGAAAAPVATPVAKPAAADREPDEGAQHDPLLSEAKLPYEVIAEAFLTASTPADNLDSPASWTTPQGQRWIITTAKKSGELALVVERDNHRVQAFSLPDFASVALFGAEDLKKPYGLWAQPKDGGIEVIVSDNYMLGADEETVPPLAQLGQRFRRYQLRRQGQAWTAMLTQTFGETSAAGAIRIAESVYADPAHDRLLLAEEDVASGTRLREYGLADGKYRGRDIGADLYKAQAEGIALLSCADGSGYWIGTDQFKDRSLFHVFDRQTLAHVGAFAGKVTANTDGVWLDQRGDKRFPQGVFYALHDDQAVAAFDWRDIARSLRLKECAR